MQVPSIALVPRGSVLGAQPAQVYPRAMHHRLALSLVLLLALPSCGAPTSTPGDAGTAAADAFVAPEDAPSPVDAPLAIDTGSAVDTGLARDAGAEDDTGMILPGRDGGNPFGDAGPGGKPLWVPLDVRTDGTPCDPLVACGGDEVGTWDVSGGCVELPPPENLSMCPTATFTATGRARGRVTFTGTTAVRTAQSEIVVSVYVPAFCLAFVPGGCSAIETMLAESFADSACVEDAGGDCRCEIRQSNVIDDADGYTIEGNQIVSAVLGRRWDYCVEADGTLRYQDASTSDPTEPGIIELTER